MKYLNVFFIVLFLLSAGLQYNDPDPFIWVPLYLYGALVSFLAIRNRYNRWLIYAGLIVYAVYAVILFTGPTGVMSWLIDHNAENIAQSMKATKPWIEETREFFGLLLLMLALALNAIWKPEKTVHLVTKAETISQPR